jgi:hypothetical protein
MQPLRALLFLFLATPAAAQAPMTGAEFQAHVEGRTLTYHSQGQAYGLEQYLPGRRVRWAFLGDECWDGRWYEEAGQICFVYERDPTPKCWRFTREGGRLSARFMGSKAGQELYEVRASEEPLVCPGPEVGV